VADTEGGPIVIGRASPAGAQDTAQRMHERGDKLVDLNQQVIDQNAKIIALMERQTVALEVIAEAAAAMTKDKPMPPAAWWLNGNVRPAQPNDDSDGRRGGTEAGARELRAARESLADCNARWQIHLAAQDTRWRAAIQAAAPDDRNNGFSARGWAVFCVPLGRPLAWLNTTPYWLNTNGFGGSREKATVFASEDEAISAARVVPTYALRFGSIGIIPTDRVDWKDG
jgi:hypothetical protein